MPNDELRSEELRLREVIYNRESALKLAGENVYALREQLAETKERLVKRTDELIAERDRVLELQEQLLKVGDGS